jgi:carboxymethylenebutenolidase
VAAPLVVWIDDGRGPRAWSEATARALRESGFVVESASGTSKSDRQALAELEALLATFAKDARIDSRRIGVIGVGRAGTLAFELACTSRRVKASVVIAAPLLYESLDAHRPIQPLELALNLDAPMLALFAAHDEHVPGAHVEFLRRIGDQAAKPIELVVYAQAASGFLDSSSPEVRAGDASDAAARAVAFFADALG